MDSIAMNLFAYGTLMDPEIMAQVSGATYRSRKATLFNYLRKTVRGEIYPAIIQQCGGVVGGIVYFNISLEGVNRLDKFEGSLYQRTKVEAVCGSGECVEVQACVITDNFAHQLSDDDWSYEHFMANHKQLFQRGYQGYEELR